VHDLVAQGMARKIVEAAAGAARRNQAGNNDEPGT
jgi:hypothetical protein